MRHSENHGIICNSLKIQAIVTNAKIFSEIRHGCGIIVQEKEVLAMEEKVNAGG